MISSMPKAEVLQGWFMKPLRGVRAAFPLIARGRPLVAAALVTLGRLTYIFR
jgi:hypothetical protein